MKHFLASMTWSQKWTQVGDYQEKQAGVLIILAEIQIGRSGHGGGC